MAARNKKAVAETSNKLPANWQDEMAQAADAAADQEAGVAAGQFFSTSGGILKFNDSPLPENKMVVVILDSMIENVFYEGAYDSDNPTPPVCYAFGRSEEGLIPHEDVTQRQDTEEEGCGTCEMNEWGSADTGKGKACKNQRRLAIISAGNVINGEAEIADEPDFYENGDLGFLKLPVTSVKAWSAYVKKLAGALKRAPFGVFTLVSLVPDEKSQFKITFQCLGMISDELMGTVFSRHNEVKQPGIIDFPYGKFEEAPEPTPTTAKAKAKAKRQAKKPVSGKRGEGRARKY